MAFDDFDFGVEELIDSGEHTVCAGESRRR
jgi:hypothetical protein